MLLKHQDIDSKIIKSSIFYFIIKIKILLSFIYLL